MEGVGTADQKHGLKRISPLWALAWLPLTPLIFPPVLILYTGIVAAPLLVKVGFLVFALQFWFILDRRIRVSLNNNVTRVESALAARVAAASGSEPVALILRSFANPRAYCDGDVDFSLYGVVDPVLRATGFRPLALGTTLPLPPDHGVAFVATSDSVWWDTFKEVARDAAVIFASLENTPSLKREIAWLVAEGHLGKLTLLMAPEPLDSMYFTGDSVPEIRPSGPKMGRVEGWRETQRIWREEFGINLPCYDTRGAMIVFPQTGGALWSRPLRAFVKERWFARGTRMLISSWAGNDDAYGSRNCSEFAAVWGAALAERGWTGPPVSVLWQRLAPAPLAIGSRTRFHPPGESRDVLGQFVGLIVFGWGLTLVVAGLLAAFS